MLVPSSRIYNILKTIFEKRSILSIDSITFRWKPIEIVRFNSFTIHAISGILYPALHRQTSLRGRRR